MGYGMKYTKGGFPFKQELEAGTDRVTPHSSTLKQVDPQAARQDSINKIDGEIEALYGDLELGKISQEKYDKKRKALRSREQQSKLALPKEGDMKKYSDLEKYDDDSN